MEGEYGQISGADDPRDTYWHWTGVDMLRRGFGVGRGREMMLRGTVH